ncbi:nitroreductase [Vineibacter terrae]|uniref:nitroreductase family protein n=1 Tax=Vineibacter terrae TaxID=2586908 RepID=UPI002E35B119|nr:nitroreductase [Vineibacter terrae]
MHASDLLLNRYSAMKLSDPAPAAEALERILSSAVRAPDHGRLRPWRFILIDGDRRLQFGDLLADSLRRRRPDAPEDALNRERGKALRAPLIIVVAAACNPAAKIPVIEQILAAGAAAQNIMLAVFAEGFGAMWKTGDAAYDDDVKTALGLAAGDAIVGFLYVGTDSTGPSPLPQPSWRDFVRPWGGAPSA